MSFKRTFGALWLLALAPCVWWGGSAQLERWHYATSDTISRSAIDTQRILRRFESSGDTREICHWISSGPTEAPGAQMCMTLSEWAIDHQTLFASILEALPAQQSQKFVAMFCASLHQADLKPFEAAFRANNRASIAKLLKVLDVSPV